MKVVRLVAMLLMVIGSLNWGLVGLFQYDLVGDLFGGVMSTASRVIYVLVGLAGLYGLGILCRCCKCGHCKTNCGCHKR
jgi:uncharacterized membrane protein YuzA (DUF378 family)